MSPKQHEMLRTLFRWQDTARPVQIVLKEHQPDIRYRDLTQAKGASSCAERRGDGTEPEKNALICRKSHFA
ncbi:hypothetical protein ACEQPO_04780 [Bacillus sp. SL00103]